VQRRIGDVEQVVFRVIAVAGHVVGCICHAGQAVRVVISIRGDFTVLVSDGGTASARIVCKAHKRGVSIGDLRHPVTQIVIKDGAVVSRVNHGKSGTGTCEKIAQTAVL
jgi:hypothetical protein